MYIDQIRILPGAGKGARVLLFTGGAGSWKSRLVAGDAEVEPEDGPCSVRGFMGPDILSARDRGTGRRGLGRGARFGEEVLLCGIWASEVTSWLLCPWLLVLPAASGGQQGDARGAGSWLFLRLTYTHRHQVIGNKTKSNMPN